ncbi:Uncharacterised protein [uncultured archaeon]|nr:Uncharacterised protein [uncultured archaeon]
MKEEVILRRLKHFFNDHPTFTIEKLPDNAMGRLFDGIIFTCTKGFDGSGYRVIQVYFVDWKNLKLFKTMRPFGSIRTEVPMQIDSFGCDVFQYYHQDIKLRIGRESLLSGLYIKAGEIEKTYTVL